MKLHGLHQEPLSLTAATLVRWWGARLSYRFGSPELRLGPRDHAYRGPATPEADRLPGTWTTGLDAALDEHKFFDASQRFMELLGPVAAKWPRGTSKEYVWSHRNYVGVAQTKPPRDGSIYLGLWETAEPVPLSYVVRRPAGNRFEYLDAGTGTFHPGKAECSVVPSDVKLTDELQSPNQWELY